MKKPYHLTRVNRSLIRTSFLFIAFQVFTLFSIEASQSSGTSLDSVSRGEFIVGDFDGDNDQDIILGGTGPSGEILKLYLNNGSGLFTEVVDSSFIPLTNTRFAIGDLDGDGDLDFVHSGQDRSVGNDSETNIYLNSGQAQFSISPSSASLAQLSGILILADVDGDNDLDLFHNGDDSNFNGVSKLYKNNGNANFTEVLPNPFPQTRSAYPAFLNIDGDSDIDLLFVGSNFTVTKLFANNGSGTFSEVSIGDIGSLFRGNLATADVDGDNDIDIISSGTLDGTVATELYLNNGSGLYSIDATASFPGLDNPVIAFGDVDGDQDMDLFLSGLDTSFSYFSSLYVNDGSGNFSSSTNSFISVSRGDAGFFDADNDSDLDLFVTGEDGPFDPISELYENDGSGNYSVLNSLIDWEGYEAVRLFPNPAKEELYLESNTDLERASIEILNVEGITVMSHQTHDLGSALDLSTLEAGMYFLVLESESQILKLKIIKE